MKVLVTYMSLSGNTKKIAEAIFQEIQEEKEIKEIAKVNSLEGYDFAFIGFPMHGFAAPEKAADFFEKHCKGKDIALFVTHGAPDDSGELQPWLTKCKKAAAGANVIDMFHCQGELAQYVIDELLKSDNPRYRAYGKAGPSTNGQPDAARVERARIFARSIMERITS
jgi:flavodoxin